MEEEMIIQRTVEQGDCGLLKLPAEIRMLIWQFLVCAGESGRVGVEWGEDGVLKSHLISKEGGAEEGRTRKYGLGVMGILCSCRVL